MNEQMQAPPLGANGHAPAPEEPRVVRHVQGTFTVVVAIQQGRRSITTGPISRFNSAPIPHTREAYAGLYDLVEQAMDELQAEVDQQQQAGQVPQLAGQTPAAAPPMPAPAGGF